MPLDIDQLQHGFISVCVGKLTNDVINLLGLNCSQRDIILWEDRFKYIHKHEHEFGSPELFGKCIAQIPEVISNPDYVGLHPTSQSIEYIKRIDVLLIVAVRFKPLGGLAVRTVFNLSEKQLNDYLACGTVKKLK